MEYKVVEASGKVLNLQEEVYRHIGDGWVPLGGVAVAFSSVSNLWWYYQAMIKEPVARADRPRQ
jgi:hypothetical protein